MHSQKGFFSLQLYILCYYASVQNKKFLLIMTPHVRVLYQCSFKKHCFLNARLREFGRGWRSLIKPLFVDETQIEGKTETAVLLGSQISSC